MYILCEEYIYNIMFLKIIYTIFSFLNYYIFYFALGILTIINTDFNLKWTVFKFNKLFHRESNVDESW